jgi:hypothetical protein
VRSMPCHWRIWWNRIPSTNPPGPMPSNVPPRSRGVGWSAAPCVPSSLGCSPSMPCRHGVFLRLAGAGATSQPWRGWAEVDQAAIPRKAANGESRAEHPPEVVPKMTSLTCSSRRARRRRKGRRSRRTHQEHHAQGPTPERAGTTSRA